jgi:hypothetical protein
MSLAKVEHVRFREPYGKYVGKYIKYNTYLSATAMRPIFKAEGFIAKVTRETSGEHRIDLISIKWDKAVYDRFFHKTQKDVVYYVDFGEADEDTMREHIRHAF